MLGAVGDLPSDDFLGKYIIFSKFSCCDVAMFRPVGSWAVFYLTWYLKVGSVIVVPDKLQIQNIPLILADCKLTG